MNYLLRNAFFIVLLMITSFTGNAQSSITWTTGINIANSSHDNLHPRMTTDRAGNPLVLWGRMADESALFSRWNGTSFTSPVALNPAWLTIASGSWMGPDIASHGDTVYAVMKRTPEADPSNYIYIVRSFDGGITFSAPVQVDSVDASITRFPAVTTDDAGNPIVGYMRFNPAMTVSEWVVVRSYDYGSTFTTSVKANGWSGPGSMVCDCCPGALLSSGNTVAMLYRDQLNNIRDSWAGVSYDGGLSFTDGWNIDQNNWQLFACPSTAPDAIIMGDSLYSVFANGASGISRVYASASSLSNATCPPSQLLTGAIAGLGQQNYPRIARSGNAVAIAWKQSVNGADQLPLLFTNDISSGFPAAYDTVDLGDVTTVDVALADGKIYIAWEDDNSGTVKFRAGTYTTLSSVHSIPAPASAAVFPNPVSAGEITVTVNNFSEKNIRLSLYNLLGEQVITQTPAVNNTAVHLHVAPLSSGAYFLKITSPSQSAISKIIKL